MLDGGPVVPHDCCPPSRRGHTWREPISADAPILGDAIRDRANRVCKRCGKLGRVNKQGLICAVEAQ